MFTAKLLFTFIIAGSIGSVSYGQSTNISGGTRQIILVAANDTPETFAGETTDQSSFLYHSGLVINDPTLLQIPGEKAKRRRGDILQSASGIIRAKAEKSGDSASADRFLRCVAQAMSSEMYLKKSIFNVENIVTTYDRAVKKQLFSSQEPKIKRGVEASCSLLLEYNDEMKLAKDPLNPDAKKKDSDLAAKIWHDTQIKYYTQTFPTEVAENNITENQQRYCFFATPCPPEYVATSGTQQLTPVSTGGIKR